MSPNIPVLFALLLALTSGSAEGSRWTTSPIALLRQTLRYWRKIYRTYHEEVALGYCWADYLFEISDELSANMSAPLAATGDGADARSRRKSFPDNVTPTRRLEEARRERPRQKRSARFAIPNYSARDLSGGRRVASRREIIIGKRPRRMTNEAGGRGIGVNNTDGSKRITQAADTRAERRRLAGLNAPGQIRGVGRTESSRVCESPSRETSSRAVNPPPKPADDDKVGPRDVPKMPEKKDTRRKVLRAVTNHRGPLFGGAHFGPRSLSLKLDRGRRQGSQDGRRFSSRRHPRRGSSRERNSRVSGPLSEAVARDRGAQAGDPREASRIPSRNNDGGGWPLSRSLPLRRRRINAEPERRTDFAENSSSDPPRPINSSSATHRWKREELSRDSAGIAVERSSSRKNAVGKAAKRELSRSEARPGGDAGEGKCSWDNVLLLEERSGDGVVSLSEFGRLRQQIPYDDRGFSVLPKIPARQREEAAAFSSHRAKRSTENYEEGDSTDGSVRNATALNTPLRPDRLFVLQPSSSSSSSSSFVSNVRAFIIGVLRTLGMFVQVGRQIMDIVESNAVLACTKEYLWMKITRWIDT